MRTRMSVRRAPWALLAAVVAAACAGRAVAQPIEVVTVEAARQEKVAQTPYGVPVREITIRSRVSYADLDLRTAAGVDELVRRIHDTAKSTCGEMDVKFPVEGHGLEACIKEAVDGAMVQAKKIVAEKGGPAPD